MEDSQLVQEKYTKLLVDTRSQLADKIAENEHQVVDSIGVEANGSIEM